ncbi:hypothetical protein MPSI1_003450 [Malassezia psittaci]|uniref:3-beta hydroxysteroid dehydrogenase/isomerase domain-containing protein n=1 Tax=Malassezia psittaci TaxID=1821823 RepID=A0AAF0FE06_9BASI|nr:hypothetical protein MPSI1_003450 [Malassezia psittaci]
MSDRVEENRRTLAVTGATGFIGAHIVREALERDTYHVRSIVRSKEKGDELQKLFPSQHHSVAYVADIRNTEELKRAFQGCTHIQHVASPYYMTFDDPRSQMLDPAIEGTMAVLKAADETETVEHLLLTSSFAAMNCIEKGGSLRDYTYSEKDWNPATYEGALKKDNKVYIYCASKVLAEQSAWKFCREKRPKFHLTTFCPPGVVGPMVHPVSSLEHLNTSCANVWRIVSGATNNSVPPTLLPQTVDVRDVAKAQVNAMSIDEAKGKRFVLCGYYIDLQLVVDYLREQFPEHCDTIPVGNPGVRNQPGPIAKLDVSQAEKILNMTWTPWKQTYSDLVSQLWRMNGKK